MLNELYRYAVSHGLTARVGYKERKVKAYLNFIEGSPLPLLSPAIQTTTYAPDVGGKANSNNKCNPLVEKASYVLNIIDPGDAKAKTNTPVKHAYYLSMLESAARCEPRLALCHAALSDENTLSQLREMLAAAKFNFKDPIGLMATGVPLEKSEALFDWWDSFRLTLEDKPRSAMRCLVTGKPTEPLATVPKISGLRSVGGHTSGDALLCFDKDAFTSYGFDQGENACVSEEAMTAVNVALGKLIAQAPRLANAKYVYFYKEPVAPTEDPMPLVFGDFWVDDVTDGQEPAAEAEEPSQAEAEEAVMAEAEATAEGEEAIAAETDNNRLLTAEQRLREDEARLAAKALLQSLRHGERPELLQNRYYIMPLSGAGGRIMVRGWMEGDFESLCENINRWFDDLQLTTPYGKGTTRAPKLFALCIRLLKPQKGGRKVGERIDDELSAIVPRLMYAIINNTQLPDTVASRALTYIRSQLLAAAEEDSKQERTMDSLACELLKAWLNRSIRAKGGTAFMEKELTPTYQGIAYQLGRLMAVYAAIQTDALGSDLGAGVLQRYYASASASPALVIGKLAQLSQHHLSKLSNGGSVGKTVRYSKLLQEIYSNIHQTVPTTLSLMQQSEFALGYYHQRAALFAPKPVQDAEASDDTPDATEE